MKKVNILPNTVRKLSVAASLLLAMMACQHQDLLPDDGCGDIPVRVIIHWDDHEYATRPEATGMYSHLFAQGDAAGTGNLNATRAAGSITRVNTHVDGGMIYLAANTSYLPLCYDYDGMLNIYFRNYNDSVTFEAYCQRATGTYNDYSDPPIPYEPLISEPSPEDFFLVRNEEPFEVIPTQADDTLELHFYPEDVTQEFTFLIYGVVGVRNISYCRGAISGMSGSLFPAIDSLDASPSTIIFERVNLHPDGQQQHWSDEQIALFPEGWDSPDPEVGWTGDWITGEFSTLGIADINNLLNRLTIEAITPGNYYYYGAWGYWRRQWEKTVRDQLAEALKDQEAWRARNGGFDIVLNNDGRLVIPDGDPGGGNDGGDDDGGGFEIDIGEWDKVDVPI